HHECPLAGGEAEALERVGDTPRRPREVAEGDLAPALAARVERDERELARMLRRPVLHDVARELVVIRHRQPECPARRLVVGHVHGSPMLSAGRWAASSPPCARSHWREWAPGRWLASSCQKAREGLEMRRGRSSGPPTPAATH